MILILLLLVRRSIINFGSPILPTAFIIGAILKPISSVVIEILSSDNLKIKEKIKINLIRKLSECSGHLGIAGGQYLDLSYEKKKISKRKIVEMEKKKPGKLFRFCCAAPPIIKNKCQRHRQN